MTKLSALCCLSFLLSGSNAVLIQCPPNLQVRQNLGLGMSCGGFCEAKGKCSNGMSCQQPCEMNEFPSASFVATEFGAPAPEGICVVAVDKNQKTFPGAALQQDVCNADVQAAAKKSC